MITDNNLKTLQLRNNEFISYERKEGHHNKWWTASREAHSKRAELTSGLSVGMFVPMFVTIYVCNYLCLFVSVCHARGVCRANQQSFWDAKRR